MRLEYLLLAVAEVAFVWMAAAMRLPHPRSVHRAVAAIAALTLAADFLGWIVQWRGRAHAPPAWAAAIPQDVEMGVALALLVACLYRQWWACAAVFAVSAGVTTLFYRHLYTARRLRR